MNSQVVAKRHACDRCRDLKLRCPRNEQPNGTCDRCIRAGALCVTGSPRPSGRRRLSTYTRKPESGIPSPSDPQSPYSTPISHENGLLPGFDFDLDTIINRCLMETNPAQSSNDSTSGASSTFPPVWPMPLLDPSATSGLDLGSLGEVGHGSAQGTYGRYGDAETVGSKPGESDRYKQPSNGDPIMPLLSVTESISRHLVELRSGSWDPGLMRIALLDGNDPDSSRPVQLNPLENTLCLTIKFALILQVMAPMEGLTAPPPCSPKTLCTTLSTLSAYLQLVQLLDGVLGRISYGVKRIPEDSPSSLFRSTSARADHVVMVMQVFGHQLQLIERLLGLPAEYRVWGGSNAFHGIFARQRSSTLIEAVLEQSHDTVQSLKRTMEHLHSLLRG